MRSRGFTLVELLVAIAIIGLLAATLVVASAGLGQRSKIEKAAKMVLRIETACEAYFTKFQDYPSNQAKLTAAAKAGGALWAPIQSRTFVFDYIGRPLTAVVQFGPGAGKTATLEPFAEFAASELSGDPATPGTVAIMDPWGEGIWYELPGFAHGTSYADTSRGPSSSTDSRIDVTSGGPDGTAQSLGNKLDPKDDVTNWNP
ncbi:MAG: type II secretion system protein [Planctomycetia bacterium]|nr:type II secretion system protein [Planctomycetia bacterium]